MSISAASRTLLGRMVHPLWCIGLALLLGFPPQASHADEVAVDRKVEYVLVSGSSLDEITDQLDRKGPGGFWGRTAWYVSWSDACEVRLEVRITLPRLMFENRLPEADRAIVQRAFLALETHEENHSRMGLFAAEEVKRQGCAGAQDIVSYWMAKNDDYDRETQTAVARASGSTTDSGRRTRS